MRAASVVGRHVRVLQILRQLQSGQSFTVQELAGRLAVCRRTVFRDLSLLRDAGVSLVFDAQRACYRLAARDDLLQAPDLDADELTMLVTAVHLSVLQGIPGCRDLLRQTTNKLLALSPFHVRHSVARLADACTVDTPARDYSPRTTCVMHQILLALHQRRVLRIRLNATYPEGPLDTSLATYQVLANTSAWQVTGRSSHHRAVMTLDPRQVTQADITDEVYAIPRGYRTSG
ncbi:MAG: HTH domain-containing protein [Planctomycetaceae bacterium]|nr:HTH domain-containing protein [Planctomycetaceae bacterium]